MKACVHAMTTARNWASTVRSRADFLPHGDVGTPERVQFEVAFAGCQAARYSLISVAGPLAKLVKDTLSHEVARYFGMSELRSTPPSANGANDADLRK